MLVTCCRHLTSKSRVLYFFADFFFCAAKCNVVPLFPLNPLRSLGPIATNILPCDFFPKGRAGVHVPLHSRIALVAFSRVESEFLKMGVFPDCTPPRATAPRSTLTLHAHATAHFHTLARTRIHTHAHATPHSRRVALVAVTGEYRSRRGVAECSGNHGRSPRGGRCACSDRHCCPHHTHPHHKHALCTPHEPCSE